MQCNVLKLMLGLVLRSRVTVEVKCTFVMAYFPGVSKSVHLLWVFFFLYRLLPKLVFKYLILSPKVASRTHLVFEYTWKIHANIFYCNGWGSRGRNQKTFQGTAPLCAFEVTLMFQDLQLLFPIYTTWCIHLYPFIFHSFAFIHVSSFFLYLVVLLRRACDHAGGWYETLW